MGLTQGHGLTCAALLMALAGAGVHAQDVTGDTVQLVSGNLQPLAPLPIGADQPAVGTPLGRYVADANYRSGGGWWALVCRHTCALYTTTLTVTPTTLPTDSRVPAQQLRWAPLPFGLGRVTADTASPPVLIALLKLSPTAGFKLGPGPVTTWLHAGMDSYPPGGRAGTLETRIPAPGPEPVLLVPRLSDVPTTEDAYEHETLELDLLVGTRRQWLGRFPTGTDAIAGWTYLSWAGDLDHDGRPDLITTLDNQTTLFLSSLAKDCASPDDDPCDETTLVGEAGHFDDGGANGY